MSREIHENTRTGLEIAVIGMAGRFPGAKNIHQFWDNLKKGVESISFFSDSELEEAGIDRELITSPDYVKAVGVLEDIEYFDAYFFDYIPADAQVMDPQIRIFHECAWTALEDAGYDPGAYPGFIGLYAGASPGFNWQLLSLLSRTEKTIDPFSASLLNDKDYLSTRISYKLNLKGPSFTMATACSTSLVAVNLACQGLLSGECDMALAGGVKVFIPQRSGYIHQEGMIVSPDGHCQAFNARAKGTVPGSGVGVVVLKLLEQALEDRDYIYAVIKGLSTNNDGIRKAGFTAPSIDGQAEVIRAAMQMAGVEPESISCIETHGTGTILGDPVEVAALKLAFDTKKKGYCALGSLKTNVGHLDSAAGIASFIKTVLMLKHRWIPANLHFTTPNLQIDFENSPFYVNNKLSAWKNDKYPLRAGVSSFGIGGTNAHVVLEEWPDSHSSNAERKAQGAEQRVSDADAVGANLVFARDAPQLILLSAKTKSALQRMTENLGNFLKEKPGINLADAAYTLQIGRRAFKHRKMCLCTTVEEAKGSLSASDPEKMRTHTVRKENRPVIFMFPGQGSQYVDMGLGIYKSEDFFREEMDSCFEILKPLMGSDIKKILYPGLSPPLEPDLLARTEITQPVIFIIEYALARLLMKWGIKPKAMIGHSIGEYVAACLSGVFSLEDALKLVVHRGKLMQQMPSGSMLSIRLPEEEVNPLLKDKELSLAAVNSSKRCVISGSHKAVAAFAKELEEKRYKTRRLHTSHAFHSQMMEPILSEFKAKVKEVKLIKPIIPYISNVSGDWIKTAEAVDPGYWAKQIRSTVRFAQGLTELLKEENALFLELGPGKALSTFVRQHNDKKPTQQTINLIRHPAEDAADNAYLLNRLGQCWLYGIEIDWTGFYDGKKHYRISLPTYPFDRLRDWIEGNPFKMGMDMIGSKRLLRKKTDMADWFYIPSWERCPVRNCTPYKKQDNPGCWLVFIDRCGIGVRFVKRLEQEQERVITVRIGSEFKRISSREYILNPAANEDYDSLFKELKSKEKVPDHIAHFWSVTGDNIKEPDLEMVDRTQDTGLFSLLNIVQAIGNQGIAAGIRMAVVSDGLQDVTGEEVLCPLKATLLGAVKIIPLEYPNITCKSIDIPPIGGGNLDPSGSPLTGKGADAYPLGDRADEIIEMLLKELHSNDSYKIAAIRGNYCWVPVMKPLRLEDVGERVWRLKERGVYLITGGMGGMGFTLAGHLAHSLKARLILLGRSPFPPRQEWDGWLSTHGEEDGVSLKIQKIREWEGVGAEVIVCSADIANLEQVQEILTRAKEQFGTINGVLHTAGLADYEGVIQRRTRQQTETIMAPKVKGTLVLDKVLNDLALDFLVLFSSIGNILYWVKFGQVGYNAANEFLDAYACYKTRKDGIFTTAVNWCDWSEVGMSVAAVKRRMPDDVQDPDGESLLYGAVTPGEGVEIFNRILASDLVKVSVSTQDLDGLLSQENSEKYEEPASMGIPVEAALTTSSRMMQRPDLSSEYAAPRNEVEQTLAEIWQRFFGIDRVGIYDDFFELGGDSLQAMTVTSYIQKVLNIVIPIQVFFARPSIKKLAGYIAASSEKAGHAGTVIEPAEEKEFYSLSSAQKRIYILQQMDRQSTRYNQPRMENLDTEPDMERIEETIGKLILRHKSLRTYFELIETEPVQRIKSPGEIESAAEYFDADGRNPSQIIRNFVRPFDLCQPPLFRAGLINVAPGEYILMIDLHHIISDGTANVLFMNEFIRLYNGEELPPLRLQYKDFSEWQNRRRELGELKRQEEFWIKEFAGGIPVLNLPLDYERPEIQSFVGDKIQFEISKDELEKLREIAKFTDSTMFMVLLAVYNIFLSKLSGQEDIVIGTVAAGRGHPGLENLIGMFVNTLVLRNYPAGERTFIDFLKEVRQRTLDVFANQDYQFEDLVDTLRVKRDTARNPIFDVVFDYHSVKDHPSFPHSRGISQAEDSAAASHNYTHEDLQTKFDFILFVIERADHLVFIIIFCTDLFKRQTLERFIKYFKEISAAVTNDKNIKIKDINISHDLGELKSDVYQGIESHFEF